MFDFGFDEGGTSGETLLVSAQFGSTASMARLERGWKTALSKGGVPFFHSKDYYNFTHGVFVGLGRAERRRLLKRLAELLHKRATMGITACISEPLYERLTTQPFRSKWGSAYSFAVQMVLLAGHVLLKQINRKDEPVNILIAEGHRNLGQVDLQLEELQRASPFLRIKTHGRGKMADWGILQAADMLAYAMWEKRGAIRPEIYNTLHASGKGSYNSAVVDCNGELIESISHGVDAYVVARRAWGQRRVIPSA